MLPVTYQYLDLHILFNTVLRKIVFNYLFKKEEIPVAYLDYVNHLSVISNWNPATNQ